MKLRWYILLLLLIASPAMSQTTVNLSVTDTPDNQTWNNGTWLVKLVPSANSGFTGAFTNTGGGSTAQQSGSLSGTGTASMSLPATVNVSPTSFWQFTVCPQGSGGCFQSNVTVTTSSPQTVALTPPSIRINLATASPPISTYATGEITGAVVGSQFFLIGTGLQICSVVSGNSCTTWAAAGGGSNFSSGTVIDVTQAPYSVGTGFIATDCTFTSGQPTVGCTTTVPTNAMVGWIYKATNGCCGGGNHVTGVHEFAAGTILSVTPATKTFTLSQNALANVSPGVTAGSIFGAGPDATTGLAAAWTAATAGVNCLPVQLPGGPVFIKKGQFNTSGNCKNPLSGSSSPDIQAEIFGWGGYTSLLVMAEGFDFTTGTGNSCGGLSSAGTLVTCFGGIQALRAANWGVTALSDSVAGSASNTVEYLTAQNDSQFFNMTCLGVGANQQAGVSIGYGMKGGPQPTIQLQIDGCGYIAISDQGVSNPVVISDSFAGDTAGTSLSIAASTTVISNANVYFGPTTLTNGTVNTRGTLYSTGDWIECASGGIAINNLASGAASHLDNVQFTPGGGCATGINIIAGTTVTAVNTSINGSTNIIARAGTGLFQDLGGNSFSGGGSLSQIQPTWASTGTGTSPCTPTAVAGSENEHGSFTCTMAAGSASPGTFTMTFAGTFSGATGGVPHCNMTLKNGTSSWPSPMTLIEDATTSTTTYKWDWATSGAVPTSGTLLGTYVCRPS